MSRAWEDLGGRPYVETYEEALARCIVLQPRQETEQEAAERVVRARERLRQHDAYFAPEFLSIGEEFQVSRELARQYGMAEPRYEHDDGRLPDDDGVMG